MSAISLIGAPIFKGQTCPGVRFAPQLLRTVGLVDELRQTGLNITDRGDLKFGLNSRLCDQWRTLSYDSKQISDIGNFYLALGGDHSLSIGSIHGLLETYPDLSVVWVDAHADINTPQTSLTGNFHGMPLAALLGLFGRKSGEELEWMRATLKPERVALIGVRELDPAESDLLKTLNIKTVSAAEVHQRGINRVMNEVLREISASSKSPIHLSFDIDAIDPAFAPATGCRVSGGLSLYQSVELCKILRGTDRLVSMDLVELNPSAVQTEYEIQKTVSTAIELITSALPLTDVRKPNIEDPFVDWSKVADMVHRWAPRLSAPLRGVGI